MTEPAPAPGAKRRALAAEQAHADRVHDRVEDLRARADARAAEAAADRSGSTFQARFERDVAAHHHAARAARYTFGDVESLLFGRLDLADGDALHVGRVSVVDEDGEVILVDWRAPAAAAFYQATPAQPLSVARRRTLLTRGRRVDDLDDELLDADAADALGLEAVTGQGALLASLERTRTGHMRDIVATIQADQDRIIRLPARGTVVVSGGPGTGKTVVALHRVAYLLYSHRERFEGRGILVVGPSAAFTTYISRVLPSLGEDRAVLRSLASFTPRGVTAAGWDDPDVAAVKGDLAMVEVCRRALEAALPPPPDEVRFSVEATGATVDARALTAARRRVLAGVRVPPGGQPYHERRQAAREALRAVLWRAWRAARRSEGRPVPDERHGTGFDAAVAASPQIRLLERSFWPDLTPTEVLGPAAAGRVPLVDLADGLLTDEEVEALRAAWASADGWRVDDVPLLDEVAALLGPVQPEHEDPNAGDEGITLTSDRLRIDAPAVDIESDAYRDFAHVVVDEAQDLSPMQWRMVARRGPYASWTVVGDLAQRSRVAEPRTWHAVAELIGRAHVEVTRLTVNYRTPDEIVRVARAVLEAAGHDPDAAPTSVRSTGEPPVVVHTHDPVPAAVGEALRRAADREGMVAVIAPEPRLAALTGALESVPDRLLVERIRVMDPRTAKGLEFDDVVIVGPDEIAASSAVGWHQLYVAVTRATRSLSVVLHPDAHMPGLDHAEVAASASASASADAPTSTSADAPSSASADAPSSASADAPSSADADASAVRR